MFKRITVGLVALAVMLTVPLSLAGAVPADSNDPEFWETQFGHEAQCFKHEAGESGDPHGYITDDGLSVVLFDFDLSWDFGDHWEALIVKAGTGNAVYVHPDAGVEYAAFEGREVSHWIVCKGATPSTTTTIPTTTVPITTTSTTPPTTTEVPTTTTVTTEPPPSTTTSTPPVTSTTTLPPTTNTTTTTSSVPPSTSVPPTTPTINVTIKCDQIDTSGTGAREPIVTLWSGDYEVGDTSHTVWVKAFDGDGEPIGVLEIVGLPSEGQHENWFTGKGIDGRTITAEVWLDGVLVDSDTAVCSVPVESTTTTTVPPTEPTLPVTGADLGDYGIGGMAIVAAGAGLIWWASREPEGNNE